jgi:drug/metabolite transporter (DMT)-like permease
MSNTAPIGLGLCTIATWGGSNFLGGYASRRASPFTLSAISHLSALAFMILVALAFHVPLPSRQALLWALCAGLAGGLALAVLYGSLSSGRMGLAAPVVAVLSSGIPAVVTTFREGSPGVPRLIGFALAILGVSLISQKENKTDLKALRLAVLAGCGFAAYSLAIKQTGSGSAMWIEVHSRVAAFLVTAGIAFGARKITPLDQRAGFWAATAGLLDTIGSVAFVRASQLGRLDIVVMLSSLYPAVTVLFAMVFLRERLTRSKTLGVSTAIVALPLISGQ